MKVTLLPTLPPPAEILEFPLMAQQILDSVDNRMIILFESMCKGIVIKEGLQPLGHHSSNWTPVNDPNVYQLLPKGTKVILEQE